MFFVMQAIAQFETRAEAEAFITSHRQVTQLDPPPRMSVEDSAADPIPADPPTAADETSPTPDVELPHAG